MNIKQEEFCRKYVEYSGNGTQAYKDVYECDDDTARVNASRLLTNANVIKYVEELQEEARKRHQITVDKTVGEALIPGIIAVAAIIAAVTYLSLRTKKKTEAEYANKSK